MLTQCVPYSWRWGLLRGGEDIAKHHTPKIMWYGPDKPWNAEWKSIDLATRQIHPHSVVTTTQRYHISVVVRIGQVENGQTLHAHLRNLPQHRIDRIAETDPKRHVCAAIQWLATDPQAFYPERHVLDQWQLIMNRAILFGQRKDEEHGRFYNRENEDRNDHVPTYDAVRDRVIYE